jgi:hypothetical protein
MDDEEATSFPLPETLEDTQDLLAYRAQQVIVSFYKVSAFKFFSHQSSGSEYLVYSILRKKKSN